MPGSNDRLLCLHGIGGMDRDLSWQPQWRQAFANVWPRSSPDCFFMTFDDLFEERRRRPGGIRYQEAVALIVKSLQAGAPDHRSFHPLFRWHAGMLAQYLTDRLLREQLRHRIRDALCRYRPRVLFGHSLGAVLAFDALAHSHLPGTQEFLVTAASPLWYPLVQRLFTHRSGKLPVTSWFDLHNPHDRLLADDGWHMPQRNYYRIAVPFRYGWFNHDALHYVLHANALCQCWHAMDSHGH